MDVYDINENKWGTIKNKCMNQNTSWYINNLITHAQTPYVIKCVLKLTKYSFNELCYLDDMNMISNSPIESDTILGKVISNIRWMKNTYLNYDHSFPSILFKKFINKEHESFMKELTENSDQYSGMNTYHRYVLDSDGSDDSNNSDDSDNKYDNSNDNDSIDKYNDSDNESTDTNEESPCSPEHDNRPKSSRVGLHDVPTIKSIKSKSNVINSPKKNFMPYDMDDESSDELSKELSKELSNELSNESSDELSNESSDSDTNKCFPMGIVLKRRDNVPTAKKNSVKKIIRTNYDKPESKKHTSSINPVSSRKKKSDKKIHPKNVTNQSKDKNKCFKNNNKITKKSDRLNSDSDSDFNSDSFKAHKSVMKTIVRHPNETNFKKIVRSNKVARYHSSSEEYSEES